MRILHFRHPNTRSPALCKKKKLLEEAGLTCEERLASRREETDWNSSDSDFLRVLQEREEPPIDGRQALERHSELSVTARALLVDWMTSVCKEFGMRRETLYASVHLVDNFLAKTPSAVSKPQFQLLGLTCLFITCKFEEAHAPSIPNLLWTSGFTYTQSALLRMEREVLKTCGWKVALCTEQNWAKWGVKEWERYWKDKGNMQTSSFHSFYLYFSQLLDTILLCPPDPSLPPRHLVAAAFHCSLGKFYSFLTQNSDFWPFAKAVFALETAESINKSLKFVENFSELTLESDQNDLQSLQDGCQQYNSKSLPLFKRVFSL